MNKNILPGGGAGDFRNKISSAALNKELQSVEDIDDYLNKNKDNMLPHNLSIHLEMRDPRDVIILHALQRRMKISKVNDLLFDHNFTVLGSPEK